MALPPPAEDRVRQIVLSVLQRTLRVRRGEGVVIESWTHTLPWARVFVSESRKLGAHPLVLYEDESAYWEAVETLDAKQLGKLGRPELAAVRAADAYVFLFGPENRTRLLGLPRDQYAQLTAYNSLWYSMAAKAMLRGCRLEIGRASDAGAAAYGLNGVVWREELMEASLVDPGSLAKDAKRLEARLRRGKRLTISHANGSSLELRLAGRTPVVDDQIVGPEDVRAGNNMVSVPGGTVYVAVDETVADGTFVANRPSYPRSRIDRGGRWRLGGGVLLEHEYADGNEQFDAEYEAAGKGRDRPGVIAIGLNPRIQNSPLLEEYARGAVLFGIGRNSAYGGKNQVRFSAWLVLSGAHVAVDGKPVAADGEIL